MTTIRPDLRLQAVTLVGLIVLTVFVAVTARSLPSYVMVALALWLTWWSWPGRVGTHTPHAEAVRQAEPDDVLIYWRPG